MHLENNGSSCELVILNTSEFICLKTIVLALEIQLNIQRDKWNLYEGHQNNREPVLENCYLPTSYWGQVDLHTPDLRLTAYPLYAFSAWESLKISYLRKIGLRCIRTNLTTTAYIDGYTQNIWDQYKISISVNR